MTPSERSHLAISALNEAFKRDPAAMHALLCNRVPCNDQLVDDPHIIVEKNPVTDGYTVGAMGLINGILTSLGLSVVAAKFSDDDDPKLLGFVTYDPPEA
jgi:hypothetical protein